MSAQDQAALAIAQAEYQKAQAETADIISKTKEREGKLALGLKGLGLKAREIENKENESLSKLILQKQKQQDEQIRMLADTLLQLKNAIGADAIMTPSVVKDYEQTALSLGNILPVDRRQVNGQPVNRSETNANAALIKQRLG